MRKSTEQPIQKVQFLLCVSAKKVECNHTHHSHIVLTNVSLKQPVEKRYFTLYVKDLWGPKILAGLYSLSRREVFLTMNVKDICRIEVWKGHILWTRNAIEFVHNFHLNRWIQQNKICKQFTDLTRDWTQIACLAVSHSNHYTRMLFVLVWGCNWILFMHGWFCPICLIHLIGWKSLNFEKVDWHFEWKKHKFSSEVNILLAR